MLTRPSKPARTSCRTASPTECTTIREIYDGVVTEGSDVLLCDVTVKRIGITGFVVKGTPPVPMHQSIAPNFIWAAHGFDAEETDEGVLCKPESIAPDGTCMVPIFLPARGANRALISVELLLPSKRRLEDYPSTLLLGKRWVLPLFRRTVFEEVAED